MLVGRQLGVDCDHDPARAGVLLTMATTIGAINAIGRGRGVGGGGTVGCGRETRAQAGGAIGGEIEIQAVTERGDTRRREVGEQIEHIERFGLDRPACIAIAIAVSSGTVASGGSLGTGVIVPVSSRPLTLAWLTHALLRHGIGAAGATNRVATRDRRRARPGCFSNHCGPYVRIQALATHQ
jgi:hypothetical protein